LGPIFGDKNDNSKQTKTEQQLLTPMFPAPFFRRTCPWVYFSGLLPLPLQAVQK